MQESDLGEHSLWGLFAEGHSGAVQSAKRTVIFLTPPTSSRRFHEQRRRKTGGHRARLLLREERIEIRHGYAVEILDAPRCGECRDAIAGADAANPFRP